MDLQTFTLLLLCVEVFINTLALWLVPFYSERRIIPRVRQEIYDEMSSERGRTLFQSVGKNISAGVTAHVEIGPIDAILDTRIRNLKAEMETMIGEQMGRAITVLQKQGPEIIGKQIARTIYGQKGVNEKLKKRLDAAVLQDIITSSPIGLVLQQFPEVSANIKRNPRAVFYLIERFFPQLMADALDINRFAVNNHPVMTSQNSQNVLTVRGYTEPSAHSTDASPRTLNGAGPQTETALPVKSRSRATAANHVTLEEERICQRETLSELPEVALSPSL